MLAIKRSEYILEQLQNKKVVLVSDLSKELEVSEETIRRDLEKLEKKGTLNRVHGGAYLAEGYGNETPVSVREKIYREEKAAIAKRCMQFIREQDSLMLDCSTTAMYIARELAATVQRVTVITNSLLVASEVAQSENIRLIMLGGEFNSRANAFFGDITIQSAGSYYANKAFISSAGISLQAGVSDYTHEEAAVRRQMIARSAQCFFAADLTKIGRTAVHTIVPISSVNCLIVDQAIEEKDLQLKRELEKQNCKIITCTDHKKGTVTEL